MNSKIFVNIDSTYRNRTLYPNPADFKILINGTSQNSLSFYNVDFETCYKIELVSLTLPNVILNSGYGNRIAFYPYVYVEFSSTNKPAKHILWSNNPNSTTSLFKIPMYNINTPEISKFVRVDGRGMTQTITFTPRDCYTLKVLLPNGETFLTESDTVPPDIPDEDLQISYTFSLTKN